MNSLELAEIVNDILIKEPTDLTALAAKAVVNRSYLSKVVNSEIALRIGPKVLRKLKNAFPKYFPENNENNVLRTSKHSKDYVDLLKEDRTLLADLVRTNLTVLLETVRTIGARQEADEHVILHSLARLEGKPEKKLFQDAGKRKNQIEAAASARDKKSA